MFSLHLNLINLKIKQFIRGNVNLSQLFKSIIELNPQFYIKSKLKERVRFGVTKKNLMDIFRLTSLAEAEKNKFNSGNMYCV
jgi:hypothetical protein